MTSPHPSQAAPRGTELESTLAVLRRRIGLILLCVAAASAGALGISMLQQKEYSASASLLFRNPGFAGDLFGTGVAESPNPTREAATNETLLRLEVVAARTAKRLEGLTPEAVTSMVSVSVAGESDVVSVTATSPQPAQARRIANMFAHQFIAFRADADRSKLLKAQHLAEREYERLPPSERFGVRGRSLSRAAEKLGVLASLQTGNAELVQPAARPSSPSSPRPVRNGILGGILGLLFGISLAFLLERLNRKLRSPEEARDAFALPILGTVPESKAIMASNEGQTMPELPFVENESFRTLRASLRYFNVDRDVHSILVASHVAGVGKSTTAWNLARVAATSSTVVIVETDMRNPSLSQQHGLSPGPGLAELLTHQVKLEEAIQAKPIAAGANGAEGGERALDMIVAGANPPNPAELIESGAMDDVMARLRERYELVVLDTAPMGVVSDAFPLLRKADGVIVVTRIGLCTRDSAARLREQLERLEAPVLGIVANAVKLGRRGRYGYGYYGGYYGRPAKAPEEPTIGVGSDKAG